MPSTDSGLQYALPGGSSWFSSQAEPSNPASQAFIDWMNKMNATGKPFDVSGAPDSKIAPATAPVSPLTPYNTSPVNAPSPVPIPPTIAPAPPGQYAAPTSGPVMGQLGGLGSYAPAQPFQAPAGIQNTLASPQVQKPKKPSFYTPLPAYSGFYQ